MNAPSLSWLLAIPVLAIPDTVLSEPMRVGLVFLCLVPSTVQSSITFTSLAGGNVASAMVAARGFSPPM